MTLRTQIEKIIRAHMEAPEWDSEALADELMLLLEPTTYKCPDPKCADRYSQLQEPRVDKVEWCGDPNKHYCHLENCKTDIDHTDKLKAGAKDFNDRGEKLTTSREVLQSKWDIRVDMVGETGEELPDKNKEELIKLMNQLEQAAYARGREEAIEEVEKKLSRDSLCCLDYVRDVLRELKQK